MQRKYFITCFILLNLILAGGALWYGQDSLAVQRIQSGLVPSWMPRPSSGADKPVVQSPSSAGSAVDSFEAMLPALLRDSWRFYKGRFLVDGAHVVSNTYGGTISEGQSYALLKAVWMDEPDTFERVWEWTRDHMRRPQDALFGWRWGTRKDGTQGLMEVENASDADQDIAYALLLAGERWKRPEYIREARAIIRDLWRLNVRELHGRLYLTPGTWEGFQWEYQTIDPSYFAPYVYRKFAQYDRERAAGWQRLANDIYDTLEACTRLTQPKLPPNWCAVRYDISDGGPVIVFSDRQGQGSRDFSYDAFRVYWRMAMDAALSPEPGRSRSLAYLRQHRFLLTYWQRHRVMPEGFHADGTPRTRETSGFAMGPVMVLNHMHRPMGNASLYAQMLQPHYHTRGYWFNDYNDYLHSVIWFHLYAMSLHPAEKRPQ